MRINKNKKLILFFYLFILIIDKCHNDSLKKIQKSKLLSYDKIKKYKKSKRKLQGICDDFYENEEYFVPLNIYIDELCLDEELKGEINKYKNIIKTSMDKAAKILKKILKVCPSGASPFYSDKEVSDNLGVNVWNNTLIGSGVVGMVEGMFTKGVHYIVWTKVAPTNTMGEKIASSRIILNEGMCGVPIIGIVTLNPDIDYSKFPSSYLDLVMIHQFTHLLGFHKSFKNPKIIKEDAEEDQDEEDIEFISLIKEDTSNSGHFYIDSENVINFAKKYFNCNSITKIDIEMDGDSPHWPSRILLGEYMTGLKYPEEQVISGFTLSYFEDLKYLRVENKFTGGLMRFGKYKGCEFLEKKCIGDNGGSLKFENEFYYPKELDLNNLEPSCSSGRQSKTIHKLHLYDEEVSPAYFPENTKIGGLKEIDYCPVSEYESYSSETMYDGRCSSKGKLSNIASIIGEKLTDNSFCALSSLVKKTVSNYQNYSNKVRAVCLQMHCSETSLTIQLGEDYLVCPREGGKITGEGFDGYLLCPDYNLICTGNEVCNDIFNCIDKNSVEKEGTYTYDYTIKTTQNSEVYISESVSTGENWEKSESNNKCPQFCIQCKEGKQCNKCKSDYNFLGNYENNEIICEEQTVLDHGHFLKNSNKVYYPCIEHCEQCDNKDTCKVCVNNYKVENNICVPRIPHCEEYNNDETCKTCSSGYVLVKEDENEILCVLESEIDSNLYFTKNIGETTLYVKCSYQISHCKKCNSEDNCEECMDKYNIINDDHTKCEDLSSNKYYFDPQESKYKLCSSKLAGCETCSFVNDIFTCIQCESSFGMVHRGSDISCTSKDTLDNDNTLFTNDNGLNYYLCSDNNHHSVLNCVNCENKESCETCITDYIVVNSKKLCVLKEDIENKKYYLDPSNNFYYLCAQKMKGCNKCENGNACLECDSEYYFDEYNKCVHSSLTILKYYLDPNTGKYVSCTKIQNCEECTSASQCTKCQDGYKFNNNICEEIKEDNDYNKIKALATAGVILGTLALIVAIFAVLLVLFKNKLFRPSNMHNITEEINDVKVLNEPEEIVVAKKNKRSIHNEVKDEQ